MKIISVPSKFQPLNRVKYPDHNDITLEEFCCSVLIRTCNQINSKLSYLPVFWTTYYSRNNFGHDEKANKYLHDYVGTIKDPWFTISQYDDGILLNHDQVRTGFISMNAGGVGDIPLPLTCFPRREDPQRLPERHIASFVGNINTYPWRHDFEKALRDVPGFYVKNSTYGKDENFEETMLSSRFALCPRGYGATSYRLYEAMQMGTIPIYISDKHWTPFTKYVDWDEFCIFVSLQDVAKIPEMISSYSEGTIRRMSNICRQVWKEYFSYPATVKMIVKILGEL
jgi:hypothetical protein